MLKVFLVVKENVKEYTSKFWTLFGNFFFTFDNFDTFGKEI